jgi:hypothetical protein
MAEWLDFLLCLNVYIDLLWIIGLGDLWVLVS